MSSKKPALQKTGCLNPTAPEVRDPKFEQLDFFDAFDAVQVKYEMLRRVEVEEGSVVQAARDFAYSRPAYYRAKERFEKEGLHGLLPKKRGPKGGHKLTSAVVDFLEHELGSTPGLSTADLVERIREELGVVVHPRSVERALLRRKKNSS